MSRRARLLPIVIFAAALSLTLKVGGIWQDVRLQFRVSAAADGAEGKSKSSAEKPGAEKSAAESKPGKSENEAKPAKPEKKSAEAGVAGAKKASGEDVAAKGGASGKGAEHAEHGQAHGPETGTDASRPPGTFDPLTATDAEIELLGKLAARREELERRAAELELQGNLLKATERRLDEKIAELKSIKTTIEGLLKKHDAEEEAKLKSLVKIYENMKPKDAARIFEKLDMPILLDVVERMREAKVAPVLADMDPSKAKSVTAALAERRNLPKLQASEEAESAPLRSN
jgi:flagellar motility protein MotE (MotC chaperone)